MADLSWSPGQKRPSVRRQLGETLKKQPEFPVTCGDKEGILHKARFNKSEPCILSHGQWFTPSEFEKFGGKEKSKKWKSSICHNQVQLQMLIEDGFLSSPSFKTKRSRDQEPNCRKKLIRTRRSARHSKKSRTSKSVSTSDSSSESDRSCDDDDDDDEGDDDGDEDDVDGEEDEDDDGEEDEDDVDGEEDDDDEEDDNDEDDDDDGKNDYDLRFKKRAFSGDFFKVKCSTGKGFLHVNRFATETCGKCIRTEDAWLTPKDFLNQNKTDGNWRRDIVSNGVPLGALIMERVLKPHMVNCKCPICREDPQHLLDQKNDDMCFKCKHDGDLVCCEKCPRAFHHHCHKPALSDDMVNEHWTCSFCKKSVPAARHKRS